MIIGDHNFTQPNKWKENKCVVLDVKNENECSYKWTTDNKCVVEGVSDKECESYTTTIHTYKEIPPTNTTYERKYYSTSAAIHESQCRTMCDLDTKCYAYSFDADNQKEDLLTFHAIDRQKNQREKNIDRNNKKDTRGLRCKLFIPAPSLTCENPASCVPVIEKLDMRECTECSLQYKHTKANSCGENQIYAATWKKEGRCSDPTKTSKRDMWMYITSRETLPHGLYEHGYVYQL